MRKAGDNDQMFGSVTTADISEALAARGFTIDKKKVALAEPIKVLGEYDVPLKLHREVSATVKLAVKKEQ
jgi:large subunit ribosomal protein L9